MKPNIGDIFKHNFSFTNEQALIYAQISGDANPIHISEEYAERTQFGRCIIHGYFSISVFSKIYGTLLYSSGHILITQSAKYIKPLFTDIEYTAIITAKEIFPAKNRVLYNNEIIETKTGELKVTGEAILMNKQHYNW